MRIQQKSNLLNTFCFGRGKYLIVKWRGALGILLVNVACVGELAAGYQRDAQSSKEIGYLKSLAEVQAHIEHIRRAKTAVWNQALQNAKTCLDEMSDLTVFKPQTEHPSVRKLRLALDLPEEVPDPVLEFVPARVRCIALDKVSSKLLTLAGYEQRAQGRRRKLMREIMRMRVDEKWKSA